MKEWKDEETITEEKQETILVCPVCESAIDQCAYHECKGRFTKGEKIVCALDACHYHIDCFKENKQEDLQDKNEQKYGDESDAPRLESQACGRGIRERRITTEEKICTEKI
jgi:hypothetical protein